MAAAYSLFIYKDPQKGIERKHPDTVLGKNFPIEKFHVIHVKTIVLPHNSAINERNFSRNSCGKIRET